MNLGGPELLIVLLVVLLLFGGRKLPELARSMGQAKKEFESGTREDGLSSHPRRHPLAGSAGSRTTSMPGGTSSTTTEPSARRRR